jgi:hypothetical protein
VTYNFSFDEVKGSDKKNERNNAEKRKSENL